MQNDRIILFHCILESSSNNDCCLSSSLFSSSSSSLLRQDISCSHAYRNMNLMRDRDLYWGQEE